jgi:hypothetical protein
MALRFVPSPATRASRGNAVEDEGDEVLQLPIGQHLVYRPIWCGHQVPPLRRPSGIKAESVGGGGSSPSASTATVG